MKGSKHGRIKAFTILELTVTMLVSAIVIAITYTSYSIVSRSYLAFSKKNEEAAGLARLDQLFRRDFDRSEIISGMGNKLFLDRGPQGSVSYELNTNSIIRTSSQIDTFNVAVDRYQILFEGKVLEERDIGNLDKHENDMVDQLFFAVVLKGDTITYHYTKDYSSENLLNRNPNAIN